LIDDPDCLGKKTAALALKPCPPASHREVLAGTSESDDVYRRKLRAVKLGNIADVVHLGKLPLGDRYCL
jgi:hypothetical protein